MPWHVWVHSALIDSTLELRQAGSTLCAAQGVVGLQKRLARVHLSIVRAWH